MIENWIWTKEILKTISSHYQTSQTLPDILIDKIILSKNLNIARGFLFFFIFFF